jgi:hypothetical protein
VLLPLQHGLVLLPCARVSPRLRLAAVGWLLLTTCTMAYAQQRAHVRRLQSLAVCELYLLPIAHVPSASHCGSTGLYLRSRATQWQRAVPTYFAGQSRRKVCLLHACVQLALCSLPVRSAVTKHRTQVPGHSVNQVPSSTNHGLLTALWQPPSVPCAQLCGEV